MSANLTEPNAEFDAWVASLPATHWSKYDLSACRLGWDAARATPSPIEAPGTSEVSGERLREAEEAWADLSDNLQRRGNCTLSQSRRMDRAMRELLSARTSTAPVAVKRWSMVKLTGSVTLTPCVRDDGEWVKFADVAPYLASQPGVRVTVKPLAWQRENVDGTFWTGAAPASRDYRVKFNGEAWEAIAGMVCIGTTDTADSAKAICGTDHETRIRAALTASIPDSGEGLRALTDALMGLERYHQFVDGWGDEVLGVKQHPTGDYVKWTDILTIVRAAGPDAPPLPLPE